MPLHDWTRVPSGLFHHFHQDWSIELARTLNRGRLPKGVSALVEQLESDVLAIEGRGKPLDLSGQNSGVVTLERPVTQFVLRTDREIYSDRANRVIVKHHLGRILAVIEIVPPGNKDSRFALREFVEKTVDFLRSGIHVLVVDLFPPTPRDPGGINKLIADEIQEETFTLPHGRDRTLASYETGNERAAYIEPVAVGQRLPDMPLFLASGVHIKVPLEITYQATWDASPADLRLAVETGKLPQMEEGT
jgi:hypothetical protein